MTNASKIQPGMLPGQLITVTREIDLTAKIPIVKATQMRNSAQGSLRALKSVVLHYI